MQAPQAKSLTVLTIATMFGLGMGKSLIVDKQMPPFRFFAATGFTAFILAAAADVEPEVAGPFALLILTVVFLEEGPPLIQALDGSPSPKTKQQIRADRLFAKAVPLTMTPPKVNHVTRHVP